MKKHSLPNDVIDHWPEVFNDIVVEAVPVEYLDSLLIHFNDGKVWNIEISAKTRKHNLEAFEIELHNLLEEYDDNIKQIDFCINAERVKKNIIRQTNKFFKASKIK